MGRIIDFPAPTRARRQMIESAKEIEPTSSPAAVVKPPAQRQGSSVAWNIFLLMWPFVQWLVAFDIVYQLLRALYYWSTPGSYAGFAFLIHLMAGSALTFLVATRPIK